MRTRGDCRWLGIGWVMSAGLGLCVLTPLAASAQDQENPKPVEKKLVIECWSWPNALERLSEVTGLPVISKERISTDIVCGILRPAKQYTPAEIIDLLNEALLAHKRVLIRGEKSIVVVAADEKIDPTLIPRVPVEDLASRGRTEIVSVVVPLQSMPAEDLAPEVKKMMGRFGEVTVLANKLVLLDTAGNLRRIVKTIREIEEGAVNSVETLAHKCRHVRAGEAESLLRNLLVEAGPPPGSAPKTKTKPLAITCDERTNIVFVNGAPDRIAQARKILKEIDAPRQEQPPAPVLQIYPVAGGNAEALAKMLQEVYKAAPTVRVLPLGPNKIAVYAGPEVQLEIARQLQRPSGAVTELIPLTTLDAARTVETLKTMFGDARTGGPYVEADPARNGVIIRGSAEQVQEVKSVLRALGEGAGKTGNVRVFTLEGASAATMAELLHKLLSQMRSNPVKVVLPGGTPPPDAPPKGDPPRKEARPGKPDVPIIITAFGNKLIVTSEDAEALALVQELIRIPQAPATEGDFEVFPLKHAKAGEVARVLEEAFNGSRPGQGGPALPRPERIRVVADPATNSLLIRASPLDMLTIRRLLTRALDAAPADARADARTWIIGPLKHAKATEVAAVIKDLYPKAQLSASVDERTNSLVLVCPEAVFEDINKLVIRLDDAAQKLLIREKDGPKKEKE